MKVGILNVTGYAGAELARILVGHGEAEISGVTGRSRVGERLGDVFPHLSMLDLTITEDLDDSADVVISALPHAASAARLAPFVEQGTKTVDISADFRLEDVEEYERWYGAHSAPALLEQAVYGLPELHRSEVASASLVASAGCYSTAAVLALAPAAKAGIIEPDIIVDGKSGVSGAGRNASVEYSFAELNESVTAYSTGGHRHLPEIEQELGRLDGSVKPRVTFLPHLVPMTRGILASCYAPLKEGAVDGKNAASAVRDLYEDFYKGEPFAQVVRTPPMTKQTLGNNVCAIYPTVDERTNRLVVIACLDNLVKGAAGQAVQNMNLMLGLPEARGLGQPALYP